MYVFILCLCLGALLLFSEELAKKALEEEKSKREEKFNKVGSGLRFNSAA